MKLRNFDQVISPLLIAEIGNNHEGKFHVAKKIIKLAKLAGADAVKFQTFKVENFVNLNDKFRYSRYKKFQLSQKEFQNLQKYTHSLGMLFISTPLDLESAKFLKDIVDVIKISSGDNNWEELIQFCSKMKKPLIISTGLLNNEGIKKLVLLLKKNFKKSFKSKVALLHCVSDYPPSNKDINLKFLEELRLITSNFGYSDHTIGVNACKIAICNGSKIIEKHFTIDKNYSDFRDHKISANQKELKEISDFIKDFEELKGKKKKLISNSEKKNLKNFRRSIVLKKNILKGRKLTEGCLVYLRPEVGISVNDKKKILGLKIKKDLPKGHILKFKDLSVN